MENISEEEKRLESVNKMWAFQNERLQECNNNLRKEVDNLEKLCIKVGM